MSVRWLAVAVLLVVLLRPWDAVAVTANGVPTLVSLSYIDGLSTWGPQQATGELELSFAEGRASLTAAGLPELGANRYQGWLVNSQSNDAISVGRFNADPTEQVTFEGTLPPIRDFGFDLFIITVEPDPDDAPQPTVDRSIGGYFSLVGPAADDSTSTADTTQQPGSLPNTGDPTLVTDLGRFGLLAAAMALALFVGVRLGRTRS